MKLAVIGAGSSYTPELIDGLFARLDAIPISEIWMMDPDADRLAVTSGLAQRMNRRHGNPFSLHATHDLREAIRDAKYVVTQLRAGGMQARIADEKLGIRHGIIGQETTGVGGFACALRTIPAVLDIARIMEQFAPAGVLVNFTNPSGIITEALIRHSAITAVGLCNIPIGYVMDFVKHFDCNIDDIVLDYVGLNHLSWIRGVQIKGKDATQKAIDAFLANIDEEWTNPAIRDHMRIAIEQTGAICNGYLQYFYATDAALARQRSQNKTRGEEVLELEQALFEKYRSETLDKKPEELSKRGGAHYSTAAFNLIDAIENDRNNRQVVCCRNGGAIPSFEADASIEATARIGKGGATALPQTLPPPEIHGLMHLMKAYETLTVQAAVSGDRRAAFHAMLLHPLMPGATQCAHLLQELLDINKPYLNPDFFRRKPQ